MLKILKTPELTFEKIRYKTNQKTENYINRLNKFWIVLQAKCDKEYDNQKGVINFKPTYINKKDLVEPGRSFRTIDRYIQVLKEDGYISTKIDTAESKDRKIGYSLFITLYPDPSFSHLTTKEKRKNNS